MRSIHEIKTQLKELGLKVWEAVHLSDPTPPLYEPDTSSRRRLVRDITTSHSDTREQPPPNQRTSSSSSHGDVNLSRHSRVHDPASHRSHESPPANNIQLVTSQSHSRASSEHQNHGQSNRHNSPSRPLQLEFRAAPSNSIQSNTPSDHQSIGHEVQAENCGTAFQNATSPLRGDMHPTTIQYFHSHRISGPCQPGSVPDRNNAGSSQSPPTAWATRGHASVFSQPNIAPQIASTPQNSLRDTTRSDCQPDGQRMSDNPTSIDIPELTATGDNVENSSQPYVQDNTLSHHQSDGQRMSDNVDIPELIATSSNAAGSSSSPPYGPYNTRSRHHHSYGQILPNDSRTTTREPPFQNQNTRRESAHNPNPAAPLSHVNVNHATTEGNNTNQTREEVQTPVRNPTSLTRNTSPTRSAPHLISPQVLTSRPPPRSHSRHVRFELNSSSQTHESKYAPPIIYVKASCDLASSHHMTFELASPHDDFPTNSTFRSWESMRKIIKDRLRRSAPMAHIEIKSYSDHTFSCDGAMARVTWNLFQDLFCYMDDIATVTLCIDSEIDKSPEFLQCWREWRSDLSRPRPRTRPTQPPPTKITSLDFSGSFPCFHLLSRTRGMPSLTTLNTTFRGTITTLDCLKTLRCFPNLEHGSIKGTIISYGPIPADREIRGRYTLQFLKTLELQSSVGIAQLLKSLRLPSLQKIQLEVQQTSSGNSNGAHVVDSLIASLQNASTSESLNEMNLSAPHSRQIEAMYSKVETDMNSCNFGGQLSRSHFSGDIVWQKE